MSDSAGPATTEDARQRLDAATADALAWLGTGLLGLMLVQLVTLATGDLLDEPRALLEGLSPVVLAGGLGAWLLEVGRRRRWSPALRWVLGAGVPVLVLLDVLLVVAMFESGATPRLAYLDPGLLDIAGPAAAAYLADHWPAIAGGAVASGLGGALVHRLLARAVRRVPPRWLLRTALVAILLAGWPFARAAATPAYGSRAVGPLMAMGLEAVGLDPAARTPPLVPLEGAAAYVSPQPDGIHADYAGLRARARGKSVVLVVGESLTAVDLGSYGGPVPTPNLGRWLERGVRAESAYAHHNFSSQALAALVLGVHPQPFAVTHRPYSDYRGPALGRVFREAGYRTALLWAGCPHSEGSLGFVQAADDFGSYWMPCERADRGGDVALLDAFARWLDAGDPGRPFLAVLWTVETHAPYGYWSFRDEPPPADAPGDARGRYRRSIAELDRHLGRLEDLLRGRGRWEDTVVALTGDHGEGFGKGHPLNVHHGCAFYEVNAHIPFTVTNPEVFRGPVRDPRPVQLKDVGATLAHLVLDRGPTLNRGLSLLASRDREAAAYMVNEVGYAVVRGRYKLHRRVLLDPAEVELFDLSADPGETRNLARERPEVVRRLEERFRSWYAHWRHRW